MFAIANRPLARSALPVSAGAPRAAGGPGARATVSSVTVSFGQSAPALSDVSLDVAPGEFVCVVGPSGSGKSTLLNVVAGLVKPDGGRVLIDGEATQGPGPDRAVVFQEAALFPWLSLRANIEFPLKVQGVSPAARAERSEALLRLVHLWRHKDEFPHALSGGMRQRGAIARALAADPAVLLMDEPFAALDPQTREILHGELERIWATTGKTILFVTHHVREAVRLADRVVLMGTRPGRVLSEVRVTLPRPRGGEGGGIAALSHDIAQRIALEVNTVAREEADDERQAPSAGVRRGPRRAVGGDL